MQTRSAFTMNAGRHIVSGATAGALGALVLCMAEAVVPFRGRYPLLGDPLLRVLAIYLATGLLSGVAMGIVTGALAQIMKRSAVCRDGMPVHSAVVVFSTASLWHLRGGSVSYLARLWTTPDALVMLVILAAALGSGVLCRRIPTSRRLLLRRMTLPVLAIVLGITILGFVQGRARLNLPGASERRTGPNVVLIVLDALRADHLSAYGYARDTTPHIDRLAREGQTFLNAHSHGNRTILAMPALFTSLYPSFHGAIGVGELMRPLPARHTTIAEVLNQAGYTTVGLMTNVYLKSIFGMTQGFDRTEEFNAGCYSLSVYKALRLLGVLDRPEYAVTGAPDAREVTDRGLFWLDRLRDRPFFLYLHYMDTHHPYTAPESYQEMFATEKNRPDASTLFRETVALIRDGRPGDLPPTKLQALEDYYDAAIRYADDQIGRLLDRVRDISKTRETIVIVTADHGDEFLEHGTLYHNNVLIEELIRVPLVVWDPAQFPPGRRIEELVRHVDVLPTLATAAGAPVPAPAMGRSLLPLLRGEPFEGDSTSVAEGDYCTALIHGRWKIVYVDSTSAAYLYDLETDPGETIDLSLSRPEIASQMLKELDLYLERAADVRHALEGQADAETIRQLKALGYLAK